MKKAFWKSRIFRVWFVCYLLVMILPTLFCISLYQYTIRTLEEKAYESGQAAIGQVADVVDAQLASIYSISDAVYLSSNIGKIKYLSLPFTAEKYYELHQRASYLENFSAYPDLVKYAYVYYADMHCLLDAGRIYTDLNQINTIIPDRIGMAVTDFVSLARQSHLHHFRIGADGDSIVYLRTIATKGEEKRPAVTLCIVLNTDSIHGLLQDTASNTKGTAYMLLPDGPPFGASAQAAAPTYAELATMQAASSRPGYQGSVITLANSAASNFTYVLSVPRASFLSDINRAQRLFLIALLSSLALGTVVSYVFASRNYKPVHMLKELAALPEKGKNDFTELSGKLSALIDSEDKMRAEIEQLDAIAGEQLFDSLLAGNARGLKDRQTEQLHALFSGDVFVAVHITIEEDSPGAVLTHGHGQENANLGVLLNRLTDDLCDASCGYIIRRDRDAYAAIFCFASDTDPNDAQYSVREICEELVSRLYYHLRLSVCAYVGDAWRGCERIHASYTNGKKAKEYAEFIAETEKRVVLYDESMFSTSISWDEFDIVDAERQFINLMLEGDYQAGEKMLHNILGYYGYQDGMSLYLMRCRMFGVINMMLNVLHEVEPDLDAAFYEDSSPVERLLAVRTTKELEDVVFRTIEYLIGQKENEKAIDIEEKLSQIEDYVAANYPDPDLSVQQIAELFNLSLPYLSRLFKREKGLGLLDYINRYRIKKAKKLLKANAQMTNGEVAKEVGYTSSQTFIRIFKRYEGDTPKHFRGPAKGKKETAQA